MNFMRNLIRKPLDNGIIIDDFHWLDDDINKELCDLLKIFAYEVVTTTKSVGINKSSIV